VSLLNNELKLRSKKYLVQSRSFAEMLEATIRKYQNRTIEAAQVIAELIELRWQAQRDTALTWARVLNNQETKDTN
jgi:hypothetical protein